MKTKMVWLLCCLCGTGLMLADEDQQKQNAIVEHITGKVRQEMAKVLAAYREVEVDEMERVLQLDAANARRLKLAARGAADQYSKAAIEGIEHTVVRRLRRESIGTTFGVNEDVITTPDAEAATPFVIFTVSKRPQGVWLASKRPDGSRVSASYLEGDADGSFGPSSLSEQPLWKNTQENILTNEQREEYQDIRERRLKRAVVNAMVAMTSFELALTEEQEPVVAEWLNERIKELSPEWGVVMNATTQLTKLPAETPEGLSDAQETVWLRLIADHEVGQW